MWADRAKPTLPGAAVAGWVLALVLACASVHPLCAIGESGPLHAEAEIVATAEVARRPGADLGAPRVEQHRFEVVPVLVRPGAERRPGPLLVAPDVSFWHPPLRRGPPGV